MSHVASTNQPVATDFTSSISPQVLTYEHVKQLCLVFTVSLVEVQQTVSSDAIERLPLHTNDKVLQLLSSMRCVHPPTHQLRAESKGLSGIRVKCYGLIVCMCHFSQTIDRITTSRRVRVSSQARSLFIVPTKMSATVEDYTR